MQYTALKPRHYAICNSCNMRSCMYSLHFDNIAPQIKSHLNIAAMTSVLEETLREVQVTCSAKLKTRNARQNLAYSPLGAVVQPHSKYL